MAKITNTKVKNWYNTKHNSIKIRQKPLEKIKSDMADNSRIFFATYHQIDQEKIIKQQLEKADEHEGKTKKSKRFIVDKFII